ncbi:MAG: Holliday junction branch migration protein RuvA, partial [Erysipelotrichaceae bacterium]
ISLFGFDNRNDLAFFKKLISVKGVGVKTAINIFNKATSTMIINAIENNDLNFLKSLPAIGSKTASQMILDLKGKLVVNDNKFDDPLLNNVIDVLKDLGYRQAQINNIMKELANCKESDENTLIKKALQLLAKN